MFKIIQMKNKIYGSEIIHKLINSLPKQTKINSLPKQTKINSLPKQTKIKTFIIILIRNSKQVKHKAFIIILIVNKLPQKG